MNPDRDDPRAAKEDAKAAPEVTSRFGEDMRAIFFAHRFAQMDDEKETLSAIRGSFLYYHRKTKALRKVLLFVVLVCFFTSKPSWCIEMDSRITPDCSLDINGNFYNTSHAYYLDAKISFIASFAAMYFIILMQVFKVHASERVSSIESTKLVLQIALFFLALLLSALETFGFIPNSDFNNALKIFFIMTYFKSILRAFTKLAQILYLSLSIWYLQISALLLFAVVAMVIFENVPIGQDDPTYRWNFTSFAKSFDSLFLMMLGENHPEVLLEAYNANVFYTAFFVLFTLLVTILIGSLSAGVLFFFMKRLYVANLNGLAAKYPEFDNVLEPHLSQPFVDHAALGEVQALLHAPAGADVEALRRERVAAAARAKLTRLLRKIAEVNHTVGGKTHIAQREQYKRVKHSVLYKVGISLSALYCACIPAFLIARTNQEVMDYYQTSEIFGILFLVDFYFRHRFSLKENFWSASNLLNLITSFAVVVLSNVLFLYPVDYRDSAIISQQVLFHLWAFSCIYKVLLFNEVLAGLVNYRIIMKTIQHILPLLFDMLSILLILLFAYSTICMSMFGGTINSAFPAAYRQLTGEDVEFDLQNMNYNDIFNSISTLCLIYLDYGMAIIHFSLVAFRSQSASPTKFVFVKLFLYSFVIVANLIIFKLVVGFIIDFLQSYVASNQDKYQRQVSMFEKYDIIDLLWRRDLDDAGRRELPAAARTEESDLRASAEDREAAMLED